MELYWKAVTAVLLALILGQAVQEKHMDLMLGILVCAMVGLLLVRYLEPVLDFLRTLQELGDIRGPMLQILLKALGIGIVTEITELVCKDAQKASLGQALQLLGTVVILWLALPVFTELLELIQRILGEA